MGVGVGAKKSKMPNYADGKIYCLRHRADNDKIVYIGSTTALLCRRMAQHRNNVTRTPDTKLYKLLAECGIQNVHIELITAFPCDSIEELNAEEGRHIRLHNTVAEGGNERIAGRTQAQYNDEHRAENDAWKREHYERNRVEIDAYKKVWYEEHREEILEKKRGEYEQRRPELLAQKRADYERHKVERLAKKKEYNNQHRVEIAAYNKAYNERKKAERLANA